MDVATATGVAWRDEVREASARLPERQRAALELRESKGLSYEQIAATLGTGAGSVAQLLERARINLYDELRGTALASVAAPSAECERALPLIAARQDRELAASSEDAAWLDAHLSGCDRCRLAAEQMSDASALFRGEAPATVAAAAAPVQPTPAAAEDSARDPLERSRGRHPSRRRITLAGGLAALALGGVATALMADGGSPDAVPSAADAAARRNAAAGIADARVVRAAHKARATRHTRKGAKSAADAGVAPIQTGGSVTTPLYTPTQGSSGGSGGAPASSHHPSGDAAVHPAKQKSTANPAAKPKPPSSSAQPSQPASEATPPPAEEPTPPAEEPTAEPGHKGEPPGKPTDRPPHK